MSFASRKEKIDKCIELLKDKTNDDTIVPTVDTLRLMLQTHSDILEYLDRQQQNFKKARKMVNRFTPRRKPKK